MTNQLEIKLCGLGVSTLVEYLGESKTQKLSDLGIEITAANLAKFIADESGIEVFKDPIFRLEFLATLSQEARGDLLQGAASTYEALLAWNDFRWGSNKKSRRFLAAIGMDSESVRQPAAKKVACQVLAPQFPLHGYQDWIRRRAVHLLQAGPSRFLIHMPTGSGKTRTTMEILIDHLRSSLEPDVTVVWLAHSEELCEQAAGTFEGLWHKQGSRQATVLRLWGGTRYTETFPAGINFVVTSFATAYNMLSSDESGQFELFLTIKRHTTMVVVDEAHQSTAPTYQAAIELFAGRNASTIGLTATPGRHTISGDEAGTQALSDFYAGGKLDMPGDNGERLEDPIAFLTERGMLSEVERYQLNSNEDYTLTAAELSQIERQLDIPVSVLQRLGQSAARSNLIALHAAQLALNDDASIIIFAPSKENAVELASLLTFKGVEAHAVTGDTHESLRSASIEAFKRREIKILVNYGVLTTGFDAPCVDTVITARPTTSVVLYSQMIGRGLRGPAMGGTSTCRLIDVVDNIRNLPRANQAFTYFDDFYPSAIN